jgi:hypothetical protein
VVAMGKEICVYITEVLAGPFQIRRKGIIVERMVGYSKAENKVRANYVMVVFLFVVEIIILRLKLLLLLVVADGLQIIQKVSVGMCTLQKK